MYVQQERIIYIRLTRKGVSAMFKGWGYAFVRGLKADPSLLYAHVGQAGSERRERPFAVPLAPRRTAVTAAAAHDGAAR